MNSLKLRLANIAFKVFVAEEKANKHWKTEDEIYTQEKWDKYLSERKKKPKFVPIIVPNRVKQVAERLRDKLLDKGMDRNEVKDIIEEKYSKDGQKRKDTLEKMNEEWKRRAQDSKKNRDKKYRDKIRKHRENAKKLNANDMFVYDGQERKMVRNLNCHNKGEIIYNKTFVEGIKNSLSKDEEEQLKNQLNQFRKERPNVNRRVRTNEQLKQEFISKMNPAGYENIKAFQEAKARVQQMNGHDFMVMVRSIFKDEEEEAVVQPVKETL